MSITKTTFRAVAMEDTEGLWELHQGKLGEKPAMSVPHNRLLARLTSQLARQLDVDQFEVRMNTGRLRMGDDTYLIPDIHVIPVHLLAGETGAARLLEALDQPVPLVVEIWSPSTGDYDVDRTISEYRIRGDLEVWRIRPGECEVAIWTRRRDGGYDERRETRGSISLAALPGVSIDLDVLFDLD